MSVRAVEKKRIFPKSVRTVRTRARRPPSAGAHTRASPARAATTACPTPPAAARPPTPHDPPLAGPSLWQMPAGGAAQPATAIHGDERRPPSAVSSSEALAACRARTCARCQHVRRRADPHTTGFVWPIVGHRRVPRGQPPRAAAAATTNERTRRPPSAGAQQSLRATHARTNVCASPAHGGGATAATTARTQATHARTHAHHSPVIIWQAAGTQ